MRKNLLRPEDMPGFNINKEADMPKTTISETKEADGTVITITNSHFKKEMLVDIIDDFPEAIQKIVAPYL